MNELEPKKQFNLFSFHRDGKGVNPEDVVTDTNLKGFFYRYRTSFGKLLSVNIIMVLGNIFLLFLVLTLAGYTKVPFLRPLYDVYGIQHSMSLLSPPTAADLALGALNGALVNDMANTPLTYVFYALSALTLFTFGLVNAGCAYLLRNIATGEPVFPVSDFFYAVKRNWKQALPLGILDLAILCLIPYNLYTTFLHMGGFFQNMLFWLMVVIALVYFFMRFYLYLQMVTFDLTWTKILKNSLIFSILGAKRNLLAFIGILLLVALNFLFLFGLGGLLLPLAVAFPLLFLFSHASFMSTYAAYYKIKEFMIDESPVEPPPIDETEPAQES
ncbi:MAG: DUF624 domain-containing protein [Eubacteriales bacterium]